MDLLEEVAPDIPFQMLHFEQIHFDLTDELQYLNNPGSDSNLKPEKSG